MKLKILVAALFIITTAGCSSLKKAILPPKVKLEQVNIANFAGTNVDLEFVLNIQNPNSIDFDVKNLKYILDINSKTVTSGTMKEKVVVKAKETTMVTLPIRVSYKDILSSALMLLQKDGMPYRVKGSAEIGPFTVPFDDDGNLKSSDL